MKKLIVEYDPDKGLAFPDNRSEEYVGYAIRNRSITPHIVIGTELLITLFRRAVVAKEIKHTEIEFLFEKKRIKISKYGVCRVWPKGFGDHDMNATETILFHQHKVAVKK